jgi:hypothetical protein
VTQLKEAIDLAPGGDRVPACEPAHLRVALVLALVGYRGSECGDDGVERGRRVLARVAHLLANRDEVDLVPGVRDLDDDLRLVRQAVRAPEARPAVDRRGRARQTGARGLERGARPRHGERVPGQGDGRERLGAERRKRKHPTGHPQQVEKGGGAEVFL